MRIDKFLKLARLVKRRSAAQEMIELGAVRLDGRACKSSAEVREGAGRGPERRSGAESHWGPEREQGEAPVAGAAVRTHSAAARRGLP